MIIFENAQLLVIVCVLSCLALLFSHLDAILSPSLFLSLKHTHLDGQHECDNPGSVYALHHRNELFLGDEVIFNAIEFSNGLEAMLHLGSIGMEGEVVFNFRI